MHRCWKFSRLWVYSPPKPHPTLFPQNSARDPDGLWPHFSLQFGIHLMVTAAQDTYPACFVPYLILCAVFPYRCFQIFVPVYCIYYYISLYKASISMYTAGVSTCISNFEGWKIFSSSIPSLISTCISNLPPYACFDLYIGV